MDSFFFFFFSLFFYEGTFKNMDISTNDGGIHSNNNQLELHELTKGINRNLNMEMNENEVKKVLKIIDTNGDGNISFDEFLHALRGDEIQHYINYQHKIIPNHNVTRRHLLHAKPMTKKIGSSSWNDNGMMFCKFFFCNFL